MQFASSIKYCRQEAPSRKVFPCTPSSASILVITFELMTLWSHQTTSAQSSTACSRPFCNCSLILELPRLAPTCRAATSVVKTGTRKKKHDPRRPRKHTVKQNITIKNIQQTIVLRFVSDGGPANVGRELATDAQPEPRSGHDGSALVSRVHVKERGFKLGPHSDSFVGDGDEQLTRSLHLHAHHHVAAQIVRKLDAVRNKVGNNLNRQMKKKKRQK
jgi:hypothetical protein